MRRCAALTGDGAVPAMAVAAALALSSGAARPDPPFDGEVEVAGCAEYAVAPDGARCHVLPDDRLVLWAGGASAVDVHGHRRGPSQRPLDGGVQVDIRVGDPDRPVVLSIRQGDARRSRWTLRLARWARAEAVTGAFTQLRAGRGAEALAALDRAWDGLPPAERARAMMIRADVSNARGERDAALALRARAALTAEEAGFFSRAVQQRMALVHGHLYGRRDLVQARAHLMAARHAPADATSRVRLDLARGWLAEESGSVAAALDAYEAAARRSARVSAADTAWVARLQRAKLLGRIGRFEESRDLFRALVPAAGAQPACERAAFWNSFAWMQIGAHDAAMAARPGEGPIEQLAQVAALYAGPCRDGAARLANLRLNQALAHLQAGKLAEAHRFLDGAQAATGDRRLYVELGRHEIQARIALAAGDPAAALASYDALDDLAARTLAVEARWRAAVGRARALMALDRRREGIAAYLRAEEHLEDQLAGLTIGEGRGRFLAAREGATGELLEALLSAGQTARAVSAARRARVRNIALLDGARRLAALSPQKRRDWDGAVGDFLRRRDALERDAARSWTLAASEAAASRDHQRRLAAQARAALSRALDLLLRSPGTPHAPRPPDAGEVILGYHPAAGGDWLGYAASATRTMVHRIRLADLAAASPAEQAAALLEPFAPLIARARRVTALPYGELAAIDLHALPFQGQPLIAARPVVYSLDLGGAPIDRAAAGDPRAAVLVADPQGNLPRARQEADAALPYMKRHYARVTPLLGAAAGPSGERLRELLRGASLFHYAGHARFDGADGMSSELSLNGAASLGVPEVLALEPPPRRVVLLGCQTAVGERRGGADLGLAQAFLLAGSETVLATARTVSDATAGALTSRLYAASESELGAAMQQAQLALGRDLPGSDWQAFRVMVR